MAAATPWPYSKHVFDTTRTSDTVSVGKASASTTMSAMSSMNAGSVFNAGTLRKAEEEQAEGGAKVTDSNKRVGAPHAEKQV